MWVSPLWLSALQLLYKLLQFSCKCSVKDVLGFSFDVFKNEDVRGIDFTHPEDLKMMKELMMKYCEHNNTLIDNSNTMS